MIQRLTGGHLTTLVALGLVFTLGCADDPGETTNTPQQNNNTHQNNSDPDPPEDLDENSELLHYGNCDAGEQTCTVTTTVGVQTNLSVQLVNADGDPIEGAMIGFQLDAINGGEAAALTASSAITDDNGVATTELHTGDEEQPQDAMGTIEVTANVLDDDDVNDLLFTVGISPKNAAAYIIEFDHLGESKPDYVQGFLLDPDVDCDEAVSHYLENSFWPSDAPLPLALAVVPVMGDGSIGDAMYPQVENNDKFTVVGVAEREVGTEDVHVAYGCNDDADPVQDGVNVTVEVPLVDHLPHFERDYKIRHEFDLTAAMPESVQTIIDIISTLADSPAEFILGCPEGVGDCGDGTMGLVDLLFESETLDSSIIDDIEDLRNNSTLYNMAKDFLDGLIEEHLLEGLLPEWATDAINVAGDITDMLQGFEVDGTFVFTEQPELEVNDGVAIGTFSSDVAYQRWDDILFQWSGPCDNAADPDECAEIAVGAGDLGTTDAIIGDFNATVYGSTYIEIEQHPLTLNYGSLLIGAIEQIALPLIFDESVTSITDMLHELVSCSGLADTFSDEGDGLHTSVMNMCTQLLNNATEAVYDYVESSLVAESDDHFRLGTPLEAHCTMQQPEIYTDSWPGAPFPYIESFGQSEEDGRCVWDTEIDFSGDGDVDAEVPGQFDGKLP